MHHQSLGPYIKKNFFNAFGVHPGEEKTPFQEIYNKTCTLNNRCCTLRRTVIKYGEKPPTSDLKLCCQEHILVFKFVYYISGRD